MRADLAAVTAGFVVASTVGLACVSMLGDDFYVEEPASTVTGGSTSVAGHGGTGAGGQTAGGQAGSGAAQGGAAPGGAGTGGPDPCGNGELDGDEVCDGNCPTECIDSDLCTDNVMTGAADTCDAVCSYPETDLCNANDGCCPEGCHSGNDNDCSMMVLVIAADPNGIAAVRFTLGDASPFGSVSQFEASATTPTASDLVGIDAVFLYTNTNFADPDALGDLLADFHDDGGRVVVANGANCTQFAIGGRFASDGYLMLQPAGIDPDADTLGTIHEPENPVLVGVTNVPTLSHCAGTPAAGATVVASMATSGDPLIVRGSVGGRQRVDLNLIPIGAGLGGDVKRLLQNALLYQ